MHSPPILRRIVTGAQLASHIFGCRYIGLLSSGAVIEASNRSALRKLAKAPVVLKFEGPKFYEWITIDRQPEEHRWRHVIHSNGRWSLVDKDLKATKPLDSLEELLSIVRIHFDVACLQSDNDFY